MRCRFATRIIDYVTSFDQPLFSLAQNQSDLLQACFKAFVDDLPLELADLQALGGGTYADVGVAVRFPRLRGAVEVRADRITGRFNGLASEEEAFRSMQSFARCEEAVKEVFPNLVVASTAINVMSWMTCDGLSSAVEELLNSRQHVQFDPQAVGAEAARFIVRGQLTNEAEAWSLGFGLEPSVPPEYDLYLVCQAMYRPGSSYSSMQARCTHLSALTAKVLMQFGFEASS